LTTEELEPIVTNEGIDAFIFVQDASGSMSISDNQDVHPALWERDVIILSSGDEDFLAWYGLDIFNSSVIPNPDSSDNIATLDDLIAFVGNGTIAIAASIDEADDIYGSPPEIDVEAINRAAGVVAASGINVGRYILLQETRDEYNFNAVLSYFPYPVEVYSYHRDMPTELKLQIFLDAFGIP
jgi:hypothetical protein